MIFMNILNRYYIFFIFQAYLRFIYSEILYSYELYYAKIFKLYNGNIVMAGDKGIYTYDNTGTNLLYKYTFDEVQIDEEQKGYFTTIVQFSKENNGLVIVLVYHILYILNSEGEFLFKYELSQEIKEGNFQYYTIVPYIFEDNEYYFILGYINSKRKPCVTYFSINPKNNQTTIGNSFIFDEGDSKRSGVTYDYGINCEIMIHEDYGKILICFYQNTYPSSIEIKAFKIDNKMIEIIPNINCTLGGSGYGLKTFASIDKKKSLVCYLNSVNYEKIGYCAVYDINKNEFIKYGKYLSQVCGMTNSYLSLDYFQETKEYIFSCVDYNTNINLIKFDQNFDIINVESDGSSKTDSVFKIDGCYQLIFYSFVFISQEYKIIGSLDCGGKTDRLVTVPSEYKPEAIYTDSKYDYGEEEINFKTTILSTYSYINSDKIESSSIITNEIQSTLIITDNIKSNSIITDKILSTSNAKDETQYLSIITDKIKSTLILTDRIKSTSIITDKIESTSIIIDKIKSTSIIKEEIRSSLIDIKIKTTEISKDKINSSLIEKDEISSTSIKSFSSLTASSIINYNMPSAFLDCNGYKDNEGTICSENVPTGYYIFDIINKILGKCHISCESCDKGPEVGKTNCLSCNENFELNNNNNCLYKYNYYYDTNSEIIYLNKDQLCPEILPYELVESKECVEYCDNEKLINKLCIINDFTGNNFDLITNRVKDFVGLSNSTDYDVIINGNNVVYEVTTTATSNNYYNISSIDFGECENILKKHYNIDYLIVFKMDIKLNNSYSTVVQYEVYSPDKKHIY